MDQGDAFYSQENGAGDEAMKQNYYSSLKKMILTAMIFIPFIPFIIVVGVGYYYFTSSLEDSSIFSMRRIVEDHRHMIESFLDERKADLEFVIRMHSFDDIRKEDRLREIFRNLQKQSNTFVDLGVFNADGLHVAYQGPYELTGKNYKDAAWFAEVLQKGYYISDIFLGYRQVPHFIITTAREEAGRKWVLRATIDTYRFNSLVEQVRIGKTGEAYILNEGNVLQTNRRSGGYLMERLSEVVRQPASDIEIQTFIQKQPNGEKYLYANTWLKNKRWLLVVRQDKADAFRRLRSAAYLIVLITVIGGGVISGVAVYATSRLVSRMERMDSEKYQLNQQLIRASRLAELGEMAAGFAHEINNPLQIIQSEQSLMEMLLSDMETQKTGPAGDAAAEFRDSLHQIKTQIARCAKITQAILKFGRQNDCAREEVDLRTFIPEVADMIRKKAEVNGVQLTEEIDADIPVIYGDPGQFQQVLLNLLNNGLDAVMERHGSSGGKLDVAARRIDDRRIEISISDNGGGIRPEDQKKIFSPFFTTKPVGKGTGLGLSVCYGIVNQMGGEMSVQSEMGAGARFSIQLPAGE